MIIYLLYLILFLILIKCIYKFSLNKKYDNFSSDSYTAVIVEPRKHKALEFVLGNFLENLSNEWNFIIFHGSSNEDFIKDIINTKLSQNIPRITFINLNVVNLTIKDYNNLLVSEKFYSYIPTEIFLIFQTDTIICDEYKSYINNYLKYDYVGAPWKHRNLEIGNGGLSLRRKSKMLEIIHNCKYNGTLNEDIYFAQECPEIYRNMPNWKDATHFSVETVYEDKSFGVHKPWSLDNLGDITDKKNLFCKGYDTLVELNK